MDERFTNEKLQKKRNTLRYKAHQIRTIKAWTKFRKTHNKLKTKTSKFDWMLNDIKIENIISVLIWVTNYREVSALLDVRHCPKLQS